MGAVDNDGRTALHCACADGALEVVQVMVQEGARMDIQDDDGYKPIHHAVLNNHDEIVKFLLVQTAMQRLNEEAAQAPKRGVSCESTVQPKQRKIWACSI